ncbi:MAG: PrgI family protein [Oscillospiraceae bacterium]|nr:PrgI family protein [Oscillospiraceae bacterium]
MAYVSVPKDLTKVKSKVIFNLTKRQLICFGAAAVIGVPTYFLTKSIIGNTAAVMVMIILMLPAFFIAMYEKDGLPAEKILLNIIRANWYYPPVRPYKTENFYHVIEQEGKIFGESEKAASSGKIFESGFKTDDKK